MGNKHSLSTHMLDHPSPFDASSVPLVNNANSTRVMNRPDNRRYHPVNLRGAQPPLRRPGRGQQVAGASISQTGTVVASQTKTVVVLRCP